MNNRIGIAGAGNMGLAIAWAMEQLEYDLIVIDQNPTAINNCKQLLNNVLEHTFVRIGIDSQGDGWDLLKDCDAVISSLPYHQNLLLARYCIEKNINYFDLGGNVDSSTAINRYALHNTQKCVMTDLGLAPGWVNIIAEYIYQEYVAHNQLIPKSIAMMVGGLPQHPNNTLRYSCTWSYDGLVNEYRDRCIVLSNGEQIIVNGMEGYQFPIKTDICPLEAFYTSGGAAHTIATMQKRGVLNCSYKTLRYPQHHKIVKFLINESGLDDQSIIDIFKKTCPPQEDLVIIKVTTDDTSFNFNKIIKSDQNFSAMQKSTAFPIASVAHTVLILDIAQSVLKYDDVPYPQFNKTLNQLFEASTLFTKES